MTSTKKADAVIYVFTGDLDINGEPQVLQGLPCTIIERSGMSYAGFDCIIHLRCTEAEYARRHGVEQADQQKEIELHAKGYDWQRDQFGNYRMTVEASLADDLTPLAQIANDSPAWQAAANYDKQQAAAATKAATKAAATATKLHTVPNTVANRRECRGLLKDALDAMQRLGSSRHLDDDEREELGMTADFAVEELAELLLGMVNGL